MATPQAWEAFHTKAAVPVGPHGVSDLVLQSWQRSRFSGVDPERPGFRKVDVSLDSPFIRAAVPVMLRNAEQLANSSTCLALADSKGTIVWRWVSALDRSLDHALERANVMERVQFSEELMGTNGVGTALESKQVASVFGADHYTRAFHEWTCVAAPVFHPVTRRVCGVVNITCRATEANQFLQLAIRAMAADVHAALHSAANVGQKRLLEAYLERRHRTLAPLVAVNDKIVISDELTFEHDALWRLVKGAASLTSMEVGPGIVARVWPVTAMTTDDGVVLEIDTVVDSTSREPKLTANDPDPSRLSPRLSLLEEAERTVIVDVLSRHAGNKSHAAAELKISRRSLYDKLHRYRIRL